VIDQPVPSHVSTKVFDTPPIWPTATQSVAVAHDTPERTLDSVVVGFGLGVTDQFVPFQVSTIGWSVDEGLASAPTATQYVELRHETPESSPTPPVGLGLGVTDHVEPSHVSTKLVAVVGLLAQPTATQSVGLTQDTP